MKFDWANVTKAELKGVDAEGNYKPIAPGTYPASITGIEQKTFKSGAFAVVLTYTIRQEGNPENKRDVDEKIFLTKKDGSQNGFALQKLKLRMMQAGLTSDQINNFKPPQDEKGLGDFKLMLDADVTITTELEEIKEGEAAGLTVAKVTKVQRRSA